jgi:hypothetical protein
MSRKHKPLSQRHKRLNRQERMQAAKAWLRSYPGKNVAGGYRKHFGVDSLCAIRELLRLGVAIDPANGRAVLAASHARNKKRKREGHFVISEESYYGFAFQGIPPEVRRTVLPLTKQNPSQMFRLTGRGPVNQKRAAS